ncbi:MAG TPA: capsule assembly Wzi family protein [Gemmatimonadaceae bacterium]
MLCPHRAALALLLAAMLPIHAQDSAAISASRPTRTVLLGSPDEDRLRIEQIRGRRSLAGSLIRSPSASNVFDSSTAALRWAIIGPVVDATWNSQIPFSIDDGSLWAGRGISPRLTAGVRANLGPLRVQVAPEFMYSENRPFPLPPSGIPGRSDYALRYHGGPMSIDLPFRFGAEPFTVADVGQSAVWASLGAADIGAATENQWWGPAIQNALVMSDNAPGIPHAFVRTNRPVRTGVGDFEAKLIAGGLTESLYFDNDPSNDRRSFSGAVATFAPSVEPNLSVGAARAVYSPAPRSQDIVSHAFDALLRGSTTRPDSTHTGASTFDQLFSLFGRWVFPESGFEVYGEWARMLPPSSLRQFLLDPQYTGGYTVGLQFAGNVQRDALIRLQGEVSFLDQTPPSRAGDTLSFYTSRTVPQGYTQRGQLIGAAIGPGGSSEFLALDYMPPSWDVGVFAQRIRWDEDTYYIQPTGFATFGHDVTALAGVRGTLRAIGGELHAEYSVAARLNFMFQNINGGYGAGRANDFRNVTLRLWFSPSAIR